MTYESPGIYTASLTVQVGAEESTVERSIVVGPGAQRERPDGSIEFVDAGSLARTLDGGVATAGFFGGDVARNDTSPGAGDATLLLIGSVGAALNGRMSGGPVSGAANENPPGHLILEVGPISARAPEVAQ